jgi:hypothetical protein
MVFPTEVPLPCGCKSVLVGGVYEARHTCSVQQRRAARLSEMHQSREGSARRLRGTLNGNRRFSILRKEVVDEN